MFGARSRGVALATIALAVGAVLSGCVGSDPKPTPTPKPSATPLFSSDAKALAAAKESYQRYVDVLNRVGSMGWTDLAPFREVEFGPALKGDIDTGSEYASKGWRLSGTVSWDRMKLQSLEVKSVRVYVCLDATNAQLTDTTGVDQRGDDFNPRTPLIVELRKSASIDLAPYRSDLWSGKSFC